MKKAVSPMVSTVLLIVIVLTLAAIIIVWFSGFIEEAITKEIAGNKKRVNELCLEIAINPIVNDDLSFGFENIGNIPIYKYKVKYTLNTDPSASKSIEISKDEGGSVNPGYSVIVDQNKIENSNYNDLLSIKIIPILIGNAEEGISEFECPEDNSLILK